MELTLYNFAIAETDDRACSKAPSIKKRELQQAPPSAPQGPLHPESTVDTRTKKKGYQLSSEIIALLQSDTADGDIPCKAIRLLYLQEQIRNLANKVIEIVGITHRKKHGTFVCRSKIRECQKELLFLMPYALVYLSGQYKRFAHAPPHTKVIQMVNDILRAAGHPLNKEAAYTQIATNHWIRCNDWEIDESLLILPQFVQ